MDTERWRDILQEKQYQRSENGHEANNKIEDQRKSAATQSHNTVPD